MSSGDAKRRWSERPAFPSLLERYELKFTIPRSLVEPICRFAAVYCSPDRYSTATNSGYYRVNTLYVDTPTFLFLRKRRERAPNRFNMRVRSYGDHPSLPYFMEVKQKVGGVIRKYRAAVGRSDWSRVFTEPGFEAPAPEQQERPQQRQNRELFERLVYSYQVEPKLLTQYLRRALVSDVDDYARVTFDTDLRCCLCNDWSPVPDEARMLNYDLPEIFDPGCSVVLELKCYASAVPLWMLDMIQAFSLKRRAFSKYMFGMMELRMYGYDPALQVSQAAFR